MEVVLIGSGNVATILGRLIIQKGHSVKQVIGHTSQNAVLLAKTLGADYATLAEITKDANIYIIAVKDHAISLLADQLRLPGKLVVHTSGALQKEVLSKISDRYGVMWPLQSIRKEIEYIPEIPFLVDGNKESVLEEIVQFIHKLEQPVRVADDAERAKMHIAAVFTSNFVNHLYALAEDFVQKEHLDYSLLLPLIKETAIRLENNSPALVQTGPAIRGDIVTIEKHMRILEAYPYLRKLYLRMSNSIMQSPYK
jgi:predicted short-subunit dehydrogenase-like oxidoreductase (DUF2520 family)